MPSPAGRALLLARPPATGPARSPTAARPRRASRSLQGGTPASAAPRAKGPFSGFRLRSFTPILWGPPMKRTAWKPDLAHTGQEAPSISKLPFPFASPPLLEEWCPGRVYGQNLGTKQVLAGCPRQKTSCKWVSDPLGGFQGPLHSCDHICIILDLSMLEAPGKYLWGVR